MSRFGRSSVRFAVCGAAAVVLGTVGTLVVADASAAPAPQYSVQLEYEGPPSPAVALPFALSPDGRFAVIGSDAAFSSGQLVSLETGVDTPSPVFRPVVTSNGRSVLGGERGDEVQRLDVLSGVITTHTVPFPELEGWEMTEVQGADDDGRFVLLRASNSNFGRSAVFLFDIELSTLMLVSSATGPANAASISISADGTIIQYREFPSSTGFDQVFEWDRISDERRQLNEPSGSEGWDASPDLEWVAFVSREANVVPGLGAEPRLYRRNLDTGTTTVVEVEFDDLRHYEVFNGGRVVMAVQQVTDIGSGNHLFASDAGGPTVQVNVSPDGTPAQYPIRPSNNRLFAADDAASRIVFVSSDENLLTGAGPEATRWYAATMNDADSRVVLNEPASATVQAVRCSPTC